MKLIALIIGIAALQPMDLHDASNPVTVWCGNPESHQEVMTLDKVYDAKIQGNILTARDDMQYVYVIPAGVICTIENYWD